MNKNESLLNSSLSIINNVINILIGFFSQTIFIKILGSEFLGLNSVFSNIISMMGIVELGIGNAIIYNLYKPMHFMEKEKIKALMHFYKKIYEIIIIIIIFLSFLLVPFLTYFIKFENLNVNIYIIYFMFILDVVSSYILSYKRGILYADKKNYILSIIHIIYVIVLNILRISLLLYTKNYYAYLLVKIIMNLAENFIISQIVDKKYTFLKDNFFTKIDKNTEKKIFNKVKSLFLYKVSAFFITSTDSLVIVKYLGLQTMGLYSNYYLIINSLNTLITQAITSLTSNVGHLLLEKNYTKSYDTFKKIFLCNYWVAIVSSSILYAFMNTFIKIWLGEKYLLTNFVLIILIINFFQSIMRSVFTVFKEGAGIYEQDKFIPVIQALLNIIFSIILVKIIGLAGVFIGTIISETIWWIYSYPKNIYIKIFNQNIKKYIHLIIKYVSIFILTILLIKLCKENIIFNNLIVEALYDITTAFIISNIIILISFKNTNELNYYINFLKKGKRYEKKYKN